MKATWTQSIWLFLRKYSNSKDVDIKHFRLRREEQFLSAWKGGHPRSADSAKSTRIILNTYVRFTIAFSALDSFLKSLAS